jgi:hypothetical protein
MCRPLGRRFAFGATLGATERGRDAGEGRAGSGDSPDLFKGDTREKYGWAVASAKKELKEIVKEAEEQGWRVKTNRQGHPMFFAPDGINIVTAGGTPSDHRAVANLLSDLRRNGFNWKGR